MAEADLGKIEWQPMGLFQGGGRFDVLVGGGGEFHGGVWRSMVGQWLRWALAHGLGGTREKDGGNGKWSTKRWSRGHYNTTRSGDSLRCTGKNTPKGYGE